MASKRRGGFRPPELRGTLGTILRTTTGVVRDAIERGTREGRARLDDARASRRRHDALAELGDLVLDLIRRGEIDLAELPEARDLVRQLDELDAEAEAAADPEPKPKLPRAATRSRFDDRPKPDAARDGTVASGAAARAMRPTTPGHARPETPSTRAPTKPMKGVWRPEVADPPAPAADNPAPRRATLLPHDPQRKGGISFDDDDLNEYMHPDDVPPKGPPRDPGDGGDA